MDLDEILRKFSGNSPEILATVLKSTLRFLVAYISKTLSAVLAQSNALFMYLNISSYALLFLVQFFAPFVKASGFMLLFTSVTNSAFCSDLLAYQVLHFIHPLHCLIEKKCLCSANPNGFVIGLGHKAFRAAGSYRVYLC